MCVAYDMFCSGNQLCGILSLCLDLRHNKGDLRTHKTYPIRGKERLRCNETIGPVGHFGPEHGQEGAEPPSQIIVSGQNQKDARCNLNLRYVNGFDLRVGIG